MLKRRSMLLAPEPTDPGSGGAPPPPKDDAKKPEPTPAPAKTEEKKPEKETGDLPADKLAGISRRLSTAEERLKRGGSIGLAAMVAVALLVSALVAGGLYALMHHKKVS